MRTKIWGNSPHSLFSNISSFFSNNAMLLIGISLILVSVLLINVKPFAILPTGQVVAVYDPDSGLTSPKFVANIDVITNTENTYYLVPKLPEDMSDYEVDYNNQLKLDITGTQLTCDYTVGSEWSSLEQLFANLFGTKLYKLQNPKSEFWANIYVYKGTSYLAKTQINLASIGQAVSLNTNNNGKVELAISRGLLTGERTCPAPYDVVLYNFKNNWHVADRDSFTNTFYIYMDCKTRIPEMFMNEEDWAGQCKNAYNWLKNPPVPTAFHNAVQIKEINNGGLRGKLLSNANGQLQVVADGKIFGAIITEKKKVASPIIPSGGISIPPIKKGQTKNVGIRIKNEGDKGIVALHIEGSDNIRIGSYRTSFTMEKGEDIVKNVEITGLSEGDTIITAWVCNEEGECSAKMTGYGQVSKEEGFDLFGGGNDDGVCGNGKCEAAFGEDNINCPNDCIKLETCPSYSYRGSDGQCYCVDGYKWNEQRTECIPYTFEDNISILLGKYGIAVSGGVCCLSVVLIGGVMVLYILSKKKKIKKVVK